MKTGKRLRLAAALLCAVSLVAGAVGIAAANSIQSTTGGCTGWGDTYIVSSSQAFTDTDATATGCNWVYSQGTFVYNGSGHLHGPGWVNSNFSLTNVFQDVSSVAGIHNLCNAGGPCLSSQQWATSD
jgi:hypothetical protein